MRVVIGALAAVLFATSVGYFLQKGVREVSIERDSLLLGDAPEFTLTASTGEEFDSSALNGKVWVVNFFFSNCPHICPTIHGKLASLHYRFMNSRDFRLVSISVDPERDTPEVLTSFAERFHAKTDRWHFLMGEKPRIDELMQKGFKLMSAGEPEAHTTRVVLVDQSGRIRGYYDGLDKDSMTELKRRIKSLLS